MEMFLQFGFGMMDHSRQLLDRWGGGTVVLSPRDLTDDQLVRLSVDLGRMPNCRVLLDPQFYVPHSDHERLCSHSYWPNAYDTSIFWQGPQLNQLLTTLSAKNQQLGCRAFLLPGLLAGQIDADWLAVQAAICEEAAAIHSIIPRIATVALSADATRNTDQIGSLVESAEDWPVAGFYVVAEHPNGAYYVDDPNWLANLLDLAAGLRLLGKEVIIGYCNQQILCVGCAKVDAICSGTWMNVRSFPPEKFQPVYDDEIRQRSKWCYCPQALSEYKIPFLDIAWRQGIIDQMAPPQNLDGGYATALFTGTQPSTVDFSEQAAFRHYLNAVRGQAGFAVAASFDETVARYEEQLNSSEVILQTLRTAGVLGQNRDFRDIIDVNRAALAILRTTRGPMLRHRWATL
jgi:hypothetical protein